MMFQWLKRLINKPIQARFDVAQTTHTNKNHWLNADNASARASLSPAVRRVIRIRSRYEAENNSWYAGILRTAVNHIVGKGPRLQVLTADPEANRRLETAFNKWCRSIQFADKLRTAVEAYWRDGEVFMMRAERPRNYPMMLDIRTFETEQVASPYKGSILADPFIDDGIRFDQQTNEIEFHLYDHHPGGNVPISTLSGRWYSSREVLHLFRAERPGQTRGLPRATPSLSMLPIMRRHHSASLNLAESAANWGMYLKTTSPAIDPTQSPADFAEIEMARNMMTILPSGWEPGVLEAKQPGPIFESFQNFTLKTFSRCTNMPFPLAAGTAQDSNFSSFKGDMRNVWRPEVLTEQDRIEVSIIEPIFTWFLESAVYVPGLLDGLPAISDIAHQWHWPPLPDLDPVDTANANQIRLASGQATPTSVHADAGQDWETEATRAATDFGVDVETYKAAFFAKTFAVSGGSAPMPAGQSQQAPAQAQGEYTQLGQRAFTNNLKRIRSTLDSLISGGMSQVMAEQTLASIGLTPDRISALIQDALDGRVDDPQLQEVPQ
jgi:capsid protein